MAWGCQRSSPLPPLVTGGGEGSNIMAEEWLHKALTTVRVKRNRYVLYLSRSCWCAVTELKPALAIIIIILRIGW